MLEPLNSILNRFWLSLGSFLPFFFAGLLIIIIGVLVSNLLKRALLSILGIFKLEQLLHRAHFMDKGEVKLWEEVLAEIVRWAVIILFLLPALEVWGLSRATAVLNIFLLYLPNVIVAVVIGFVGIVSANLIADIVKRSVKSVGSTSANALSVFAKAVIVFFTALVILNQLGVAQDLVQILFTGIVGMLALAGGLAFGLGGREMAKSILEELRRKVK